VLTACPVPGKKKSADLVAAFIEGAPRDAVGRVFFGVTEGNLKEWRQALAGGEPWFYGDNAYFDATRGDQFRFTKNRLQHDGEGESDGKRFDALGLSIEAKPRDPGGPGYVLCVPQSPDFMRLVIDYRGGDWIEHHKAQLKGPFRVRKWSPDKLALQRSLPQDLVGARMVLTHSSAAAVSAVLAGIACHVSVYSAAFHQRTMRDAAERRRWASVLADNQFTVEELCSGYAWGVLNGQ
jgi:hypothetical protein